MIENNEPQKRTCLGKIATAHGIKGLVKVLVYGDDPHLIDRHGAVFTSENGSDTIALTMKNSMGKYWLGAVEGINDRTQAETLRGTELWIDRTHLPATNKDEFYYDDLAGLTAEDENGNKVGTVLEAVNFGAGDLLEIKPLSGESFFIPFNDDHVPVVDIENKKVIIVLPQGMS